MLRKTVLLLCFLFAIVSAEAQLKALSRARIRTTSGTYDGYVRNRAKAYTPTYFDFSEASAGPFRRLTAADLLRVELEDSTVFERHHVRMAIMGKPVSFRQKTDYTPQVYFDGPVLVEQLLEGEPSLYGFTDSFEVEHFFYRFKDSSNLQTIVYEPYDDPSERGQFGWRNELERLGISAGCGEGVRSDVTYVSYDTRAMIQYFRQLNTCAGHTARVVGRFNKVSNVTRAGIMAGGLHSTEYTNLPLGGSASMRWNGFIAGGWVDFFPRRQNANLMVGIGLGMSFRTGNNGDGTKALRFPFASFSSNELFFDVAVRRLFGNQKLRPFLEGGVALNIAVKGYTNYTVLDQADNPVNYEYNNGGTRTAPYLGAGIYTGAGSLHLRYQQPFIG
ncbi:MAG: hypothetical protein EOO15_18695, partial [Chitinophagaceae bacterium]